MNFNGGLVQPPTDINAGGTVNDDYEKACNQDHLHTGSMSAQFDLRLGWGKWKWKMFSIDYNLAKGSDNDCSSI
jgi:hypothetical protein